MIYIFCNKSQEKGNEILYLKKYENLTKIKNIIKY